jgi:hypothetical protein
VPSDFELNGKEIVLTATVTYETGQMYGTVTGSSKITLAPRTR